MCDYGINILAGILSSSVAFETDKMENFRSLKRAESGPIRNIAHIQLKFLPLRIFYVGTSNLTPMLVYYNIVML